MYVALCSGQHNVQNSHDAVGLRFLSDISDFDISCLQFLIPSHLVLQVYTAFCFSCIQKINKNELICQQMYHLWKNVSTAIILNKIKTGEWLCWINPLSSWPHNFTVIIFIHTVYKIYQKWRQFSSHTLRFLLQNYITLTHFRLQHGRIRRREENRKEFTQLYAVIYLKPKQLIIKDCARRFVLKLLYWSIARPLCDSRDSCVYQSHRLERVVPTGPITCSSQ